MVCIRPIREKQAFLDKIKCGVEYRFVWESYQRNKSLENPSVAVTFMEDLESEILTAPEEASLEAFVRKLETGGSY
jgi:hypothetical protein